MIYIFALLFYGGMSVVLHAQDNLSTSQQIQDNKPLTYPPFYPLFDRPIQLDTQQQDVNTLSPITAEGPPFKIIIIGDTLAGQLFQGLHENSSSSFVLQNHIFRDVINGSSGLVRDDFHNWQAEIEAHIDEWSPKMILIMLGANDHQYIGEYAPQSEGWKQEYRQRVIALLSYLQKRRVKLVFVGVPPFKFSTMNKTALYINTILKNETQNYEANFIDIWEKFNNEEGDYSPLGPSLSGQNTQLRRDDGVHFTQKGREKLAYFVHEALQNILKEDNFPPSAFLNENDIELRANPNEISLLPCLKLHPVERDLDCHDKEMTEEKHNIKRDTSQKSAIYMLYPSARAPRSERNIQQNELRGWQLYHQGILPTPPQNRSDDFKWNKDL